MKKRGKKKKKLKGEGAITRHSRQRGGKKGRGGGAFRPAVVFKRHFDWRKEKGEGGGGGKNQEGIFPAFVAYV